MRSLALSCPVHVFVGFVLLSGTAAAQGAAGSWEVEVHGGMTQANSPSGGVATLPDPGAPFRTVGGLGPLSRRESSWYFGDGAVLLNQVNAAMAFSPGRYKFLFGGVIPVEESDTVTVRYSSPGRALVGVFGGGFKCTVSSRSGIRVDVRVHLNHRDIDTLLDETPSVLTSIPGGTASATTPSLQFASNPPLDSFGPSTLSGPALVGFKSFAGSGIQSQIGVTAGWFWRF